MIKLLCSFFMGMSFDFLIKFINGDQQFKRRVPADKRCRAQIDGEAHDTFKNLVQIPGLRPFDNFIDLLCGKNSFFFDIQL